MSNTAEETLAEMEEEEGGVYEQRGSENDNENENENDDLSHEWETMARAWLCSFPEAKAVSMAEVESWIDSNLDSLPDGIKSMPRSDLSLRLISIQNMRLPNQGGEGEEEEASPVDTPHARFQRTDQWRPVYSWLESLDKDEVVKSKDISDWLTENPNVQEQLCSRHSRYHLMHYIKKCHMKILKRREKKKGFQQSEKPASLKVNKDVVMKQPAVLPSLVISPAANIPKDSDVYLAKRKEALQKYEILVELEKLLSPSVMRQELSK
ncbi:hypothetical protein L484_005509 [Morus notabilis]|uniref:Channel forming colicins domain-containing protein n=1 Tax=Morus notabilis TaxID=981085 RepID=W9RMC7_9ROSA|nr:uncharacterized protein LOC21388973 [Morus notabilis]EXB98020.1 hypothetical protein L484_005509 [Morus notabilis]